MSNMSNPHKNTNFDFITDPDDPSVQDKLTKLLDLIKNDDSFVLSEDDFNQGLVRYTSTTPGNNIGNSTINKSADKNNTIERLTELIAYTPVTVTFDLSPSLPVPITQTYEDIGSVIEGLSSIVKAVTSSNLSTTVATVEVMKLEHNRVVFTPITDEQIGVYSNPAYLDKYYGLFDDNFMVGYQVLSDDPLVDYVLTTLYDNNDYSPQDLKIRQIDRLVLLPVGNTYSKVSFYSEVRDRIQTIIKTKRDTGYFAYEIGLHNLADISLLSEMAPLWNTQIVYEEDPAAIVLKTTADLGQEPSLWYKNNINVVKHGEFPVITLYGDWQRFGDIDNPRYSAILQYKGFLAYRRLGLEDPFIQPFTHTVRSNPDYSISVSLPTYNHVIIFKKYLLEELSGYLGPDNHNNLHKTPIYAEYCDSLLDGVIKRYYVQGIDSKALPMVLTVLVHISETSETSNMTDTKYEEKYVLVFSSVFANKYEDYAFDFDKVDLIKVKQDLVTDLKRYYSICHQQMEPVTLDNIGEMELQQLLDLVEIKERSDQPSFCYSKQTLLSLNRPVNPLTRRPLQDNILIKAMLMDLGLLGLFNVGNLIGLYPDMPRKILVPPKSGLVIINKQNLDPILQNILGDVYDIEVGFDDGTVSSLFEIATSNQSELEKVVKDLWNAGFFLTYWVAAVQKYSNEIHNFEIIINNPLLIQAANTKDSGERAMKYLEVSNQK